MTSKYEPQEFCPYSHASPIYPFISKRIKVKGKMKYKPSLPERELVDTHSHLQFCQVPFCKQCWFTHLCLRHSASAVTQFISQRMMGVPLFLCHCFLSLTVSLFTSISICFHLYEFTSSSGFFFLPLRSYFLQLYDVIILDILLE